MLSFINIIKSIIILIIFIVFLSEWCSSIEYKKCQMIYLNLLQNYDRSTSSFVIYQEWSDTERCDKYHNMEEMRINILNKYNLVKNMEIREELKYDLVIFHYLSYAHQHLSSALNWYNYIKYYLMIRSERTYSIICLIILFFTQYKKTINYYSKTMTEQPLL